MPPLQTPMLNPSPSRGGGLQEGRLAGLREALEAGGYPVSMGAASSDREQGGESLASLAGLHEWFGGDDAPAPLAVLVGMAWRLLGERADASVLWVGRRCWPYAQALVRRGRDEDDARLLDRSLFVDAGAAAERAWALELAARCSGVALVVGDASGLTMAQTRRLQLAATGSPLYALRPGRDRSELSAAQVRWAVVPDGAGGQSWRVELWRCKGAHAPGADGGVRWWTVRRDDATGEIGGWTPGDGGVVAAVRDGSGPTPGTRLAQRRA